MRKTPLLIVAGIAAAAVAVYHYTVHAPAGKKQPGGIFNTPRFGLVGSNPAYPEAGGLFGTPLFGAIAPGSA